MREDCVVGNRLTSAPGKCCNRVLKEDFQVGKKTGFREIANRAGVSVATVSRVASGSAHVSREVQARVRAAALQLGMDLERGQKRNKIIAFVLSNRDVLHSFQARVLVGAEASCSSQNWEVLFVTFRYPLGTPPNQIHLPRILTRRDIVRAVILSGTNSASTLCALATHGIPFAVLGNNVVGEWRPEACDVVSVDDIQGAFDMTSHLIGQGHRHIWFLGDLQLPWFANCAEGYRRAMAGAGYEPRSCEMGATPQELGFLGAKSILARGEPVTAIFAGNDQVAQGVYRALRDLRIRIPGDISVVGVNDTDGAALIPALTTVREFPEELGKHLARSVLQRIAAPDSPPQQLTLPTQLIRRESCGPPP
jgi:LacI family transcriptional regulator